MLNHCGYSSGLTLEKILTYLLQSFATSRHPSGMLGSTLQKPNLSSEGPLLVIHIYLSAFLKLQNLSGNAKFK